MDFLAATCKEQKRDIEENNEYFSVENIFYLNFVFIDEVKKSKQT